MDAPLFNDNIIYKNNENMANNFLDLNFTTICVDTKPKITTINYHPIQTKCNGMDKFSTVLLSKTQKIISDKNGTYDQLDHENLIENNDGQIHIDNMSQNTTTMSFFKHLKHHFAQNLFDQLRNSVNEIYKEDIKHFRPINGFITLTAEEIRDRALLLKKCMNTTDISILQIYMALRERYSVIESAIIPSIGSLLHNNGYCKPCVFANKKTNYCKTGFHCNFCHYNHKTSKSKNAKLQLAKIPSEEYISNLRHLKRDDSLYYSSNGTLTSCSPSSSTSSLINLMEIQTPMDHEYYRYFTT